MDEIDLKQVFEPFYEEDEFQKIRRRLEAEQSSKDGGNPPIVFFGGVNEAEKKVVEKHFEEEKSRLQTMLSGDVKDTVQNGVLAIPQEQEIQIYGGGMDAVLALSLMKHPGLAGKQKKTNAYILMRKFLSVCDVRYFEGDFYVRMDNVFVLEPEQDIKALLFRVLEVDVAMSGNPQVLRQVLEFLSSYPEIRMEQTTDDLEHLYFQNGCLNVVNGTFRPIDRTDFFISYLDSEYPVGYEASCPCFEAYLSTVSGGDPEIIECIWNMLGYIISPDMSAKCFFLLQGVGDSGKSVLGDLIASLFNAGAVAHIDIFRFKDRFSASGLQKCRVNVSMDLPNARLSNEAVGMIKMLTGGDGVTLEKKFKDATPYVPRCKLVFGSNYQLCLACPDEAFANRLVCIPFMNAVPKERQDPTLREKLRKERPGIITKAIAGYWRLRQRNYRFPMCGGGGSNAIRGFVPLGDVMEHFLKERCVFEEGVFTPTDILLAAFNDFCDAHGIPGMQNGVQFSRQLNQYCAGQISNGKKRVRGIPKNGYYGVRLSDETEEKRL